jgi:hypothetical protein
VGTSTDHRRSVRVAERGESGFHRRCAAGPAAKSIDSAEQARRTLAHRLFVVPGCGTIAAYLTGEVAVTDHVAGDAVRPVGLRATLGDGVHRDRQVTTISSARCGPMVIDNASTSWGVDTEILRVDVAPRLAQARAGGVT